ncbi:MAG: hypothetical protein ACFFFT_05125 [Candidatus Thorarchaeota archaeon]
MSRVKKVTNIIEPVVKENDFRVCIELDNKLRSKVKFTAKELSSKYYPYDALCWALAEFQMIFEKGDKGFSEQDVINQAEKIMDSSLSYEEVCWLISMLKVYLEETNLYP